MLSAHETRTEKSTDVWLTPLALLNALGKFDLDPCGHPDWPTAKNALYEPRGLLTPWEGRVWLNPPYSNVGPFMKRLAEHQNGIALVFARTDTKWFHYYVLEEADSVFFIARRVRFHKPDGSCPKGSSSGAPSCLVAYGSKNAQAISKAYRDGLIKGRHVWLKG